MKSQPDQQPFRDSVRLMLLRNKPGRGAIKWLSETSHIPYSSLTNWLGGQSRLGHKPLSAIAAALGVTSLIPLQEREPGTPGQSGGATIAESDRVIRAARKAFEAISNPDARARLALGWLAMAQDEEDSAAPKIAPIKLPVMNGAHAAAHAPVL